MAFTTRNSTIMVALAIVCTTAGLKGSPINKAFEALSIYDFFKARVIFQKVNAKKKDAMACYGLAVIHSSNNNPFYDLDSAVKYVTLAHHTWLPGTKTFVAGAYKVDSLAILQLNDSIAYRKFRTIEKSETAAAFDAFLTNYYLCQPRLIKKAVALRDELELNEVIKAGKSSVTDEFILTHPQSSVRLEAIVLRDRQVYNETTVDGDAGSYVAFLARYPGNTMVHAAYDKLFGIYRARKDTRGLASFVKNYPEAPQALEAWKLLFSLKVKSFSYHELKNFLAAYPDFPLRNSILHELELNKLVLYPCQKGEFNGFVDPEGKFAIAPVYDAVTSFQDGLSLVSRNDSVFFINKENNNVFARTFAEAYVFRNGIAPVKSGQKWFFINRQGQTVSKPYDEVNEVSNGVYVVKLGDRYGALDHFGQTIIEPRFDQLGDFKNGFAYYVENGTYGFVSKGGSVRKAEFEWISDFNEEYVAVFRRGNKYGLVASSGEKLLEADFDQVLRAGPTLFILVLNNNYGFYDSRGCYITSVAFDYLKEKGPEYYTNGVLFRLIRKNEQSLVNENGRTLVGFGIYDDMGFPSNGLMWVRRKTKYGYTDANLTVMIPLKYLHGGDFTDSLAIVRSKDMNILINTHGKEIVATAFNIEKVNARYFLINDGVGTLLGPGGGVVMTGVENVQTVEGVMIITLNTGEIKLLSG